MSMVTVPTFGLGIKATRTQDLAEPADERHHVGRRNTTVESDGSALNGGNQILRPDDVRPRRRGLVGLGAARENRDAQIAPGSIRKIDHPAHHLIGMLGVDPKIHRDLDGFIEFRCGALPDELDRLGDRIKLDPVNSFARLLHAFSDMCHRPTPQSRGPWNGRSPQSFAPPHSIEAQLRSGIFFSAISWICAFVILPAKPRPAVFEPDWIPEAFFRK